MSDITKITLVGPHLAMWDVDRTLRIPDDYADCKVCMWLGKLADEAPVIATHTDDEGTYVKIPDDMLQEKNALTVFCYDGTHQTKATFYISYSPKPSSYVCDPGDYVTYEKVETLLAAMQSIVDSEETILETITEYKDEASESAGKATSSAQSAGDFAASATTQAQIATAKATEAADSATEAAEAANEASKSAEEAKQDYSTVTEALEAETDRAAAEETTIKANLSTIQNADKSATSGYVWTATASGATWKESSGGGGGSVTVDDALSSTSENPVQNKVIKAELDKHSAIIINENNDFTQEDLHNLADGIYYNMHAINVNGSSFSATLGVGIITPITYYDAIMTQDGVWISDYDSDKKCYTYFENGYLYANYELIADNLKSSTDLVSYFPYLPVSDIGQVIRGNEGQVLTADGKDGTAWVDPQFKNPNALTINGTSYDGSEAVEMTIGGDSYRLINSFDISSDNAVANLFINQDSDGNTFELNNFIIKCKAIKPADETKKTSLKAWVCRNATAVGYANGTDGWASGSYFGYNLRDDYSTVLGYIKPDGLPILFKVDSGVSITIPAANVKTTSVTLSGYGQASFYGHVELWGC